MRFFDKERATITVPGDAASAEATVTTKPAEKQSEAPSVSVTIPDELLGRSYEDSVKRLEAAGLEVERVDVTDVDQPENTVVDVEPDEGSAVSEGETITLFVSEPTESPDKPGKGKGEGHGKGKGKKS